MCGLERMYIMSDWKNKFVAALLYKQKDIRYTCVVGNFRQIDLGQ